MTKKNKKNKISKRYRKIIYIFIILAILLFAFIIYYSFSRTNIYITPKIKNEEEYFSAVIYENDNKENKSLENYIPGVILEKEIQNSLKVTDLGEPEEIPAQAQGEVTIYNEWNQTQPLAATTRFLSEKGLLFRTKQRVDVPPGSSVKVEIYADKKGSSGNIEPSKFTIPGLSSQMQELVWAESQEAMTGGTKKVNQVTSNLVLEKQKEMIEQIKQENLNDLKKKINDINPLYSLSENQIKYQILEKNIEPEVGRQAEEFNINLKVKLIALAFSKDNLKKTAREKISENLKSDHQIKENSFDLEYQFDTFNLENQTAQLKVTAKASSHLKLSSAIFNRDNLTNKDRQQIRSYFLDHKDISEVTVKFSPFWVFQSPSMKDHIEIRLNL
ncbi:MAG: hypothetical protein U5L76_02800 [Patescibacteria group bacterium]|nr:hypothetical protein [Patescibacteria group bacterium]